MPTATPCNLGILVSGRGSNMLAIVRAIERKEIKGARVAVVISDRRDAKALDSAMRHGIDAVWLDPEEAASRLDYDRRILDVLREKGVTPKGGLLLLAGFMRLLSPEFVEAFSGRIMNVHPALLPSFPGLRAQQQAIEYGVKVSGCTVHFVVPQVDSGPVILQTAVKVEEGDTTESLSARILKQEHRIYPLAVELFVEGRLKIEGRKVVIRGK
ncbi:MAG TPA: phosphoribosylglycinamide formyltransferase [Nitrososphaerales archaeon]|nr:phosphoribosylglycinamide formyltransferase [Nitrososphaerales archaeon]